MAYNVTREMLTEVLENYIKLAKKNGGEVVVLNKTSDEADEYVIKSIKDFNIIKTKKNDFIEVTVYDDDDDDIAYEEFTMGDGSDYDKICVKILGKKAPQKDEKTPKESKKGPTDSKHPFEKFIKK